MGRKSSFIKRQDERSASIAMAIVPPVVQTNELNPKNIEQQNSERALNSWQGQAEILNEEDPFEVKQQEKISKNLSIFFAVALLNFLIFGLISEFKGLEASKEALIKIIMHYGAFLALPLAVWSSIPIFNRSLRLYKLEKMFSIEVSLLFSLTLTTIYTILATTVFAQDYLNSGFVSHPVILVSSIVLVYVAYLKNITYLRSNAVFKELNKDSQLNLIKASDSSSDVQNQEIYQKINLKTCQLGDKIVVKTGEIIPLDGVVTGGAALIEDINFSRLPKKSIKLIGSEAYAYSKVLEGYIEIAVRNEYLDTVMSFFIESFKFAKNLPPYVAKYTSQLISGITLGQVLGSLIAFLAIKVQGYSYLSSLLGSISVTLISVITVVLFQLENSTTNYILQLFNRGILVASRDVVSRILKTKNLLVDPEKSEANPKILVEKLAILDDRLDEKSVYSLIVSLLSSHSSGIFRMIANELADKVKISNLKTSKHIAIDTEGVTSEIEGCTFRFGTEEFLLKYGTVFQSSDFDSTVDKNSQYFLVINKDVYSRIVIKKVNEFDHLEVFNKLRTLNIKSSLITKIPQAEADNYGKQLGLELTQVFGGLNEETYLDKLCSKTDALHLYLNSKLKADAGSPAVTAGYFDELLWELDNTDVTFMSRNPESILYFFKTICQRRAVSKLLFFSTSTLSLLLFLGILAGYLQPLYVAAVVVLSFFATTGLLVRK